MKPNNVWRTPGSTHHLPGTISPVKHGGGRINLNGAKYRNMLNENLFHRPQNLKLDWKFTSQHSNMHSLKTKQEWLRDNSVIVLDWPRPKPDLTLTGYLETRKSLHYDSPSNQKELRRVFKKKTSHQKYPSLGLCPNSRTASFEGWIWSLTTSQRSARGVYTVYQKCRHVFKYYSWQKSF